jgi:phospholipid/cholesterol/gamma-HCH transport system ATP-binding protein
MIEIHNVQKSFNGNPVLRGIDCTFETGKCNLLLGGSGTGKSVLLQCIVGLMKPDLGSITFDGTVFTNNKVDIKQEIRRKIGMLFQGGALFDSMTVYENTEFPLRMLTPEMSREERRDRVEFCLKRVGLENAGNKMPSEISGGMKKRVGIARAIAPNCTYLFCDEPNSGLDPATSIKIDELIHEITHEYGITTVVITHDMNSVVEIGDHIIYLHQGRKLWDGNKDEILNTTVPELKEFIFSSSLVRAAKKVDEETEGGLAAIVEENLQEETNKEKAEQQQKPA